MQRPIMAADRPFGTRSVTRSTGADLVDCGCWLTHPVDVDDISSVIAWVRAALERDAGFPPDVALRAANLCCRKTGHLCIYKAAELISVAWGTTRLSAGAAWWKGPGAWLVEKLQVVPDPAFDWVDEAYCAIGESLAEPAPDAYDPNWPPHKVFWAVDIPHGRGVGDTFVVGNGMGDRYRMKVIQREGRIGVAVEEWVGHPLRARDDDAYAEAKVRWPELTAACWRLHRS